MSLLKDFKKEYQELPEYQQRGLKQKFYSSVLLLFFAFLFFLFFYG